MRRLAEGAIEYPGYGEGALPTKQVRAVYQHQGNVYVVSNADEMFNCHPASCQVVGADGEIVNHPNGVYPIRWKLHRSEIERLPFTTLMSASR